MGTTCWPVSTEDVGQQTSLTSKASLVIRLKAGQSVQEHVKAITEIFNELSVIGDNIKDEDRVVYLLASLPEIYDMLVTALEANTDVPNMELS